MPTNCTAISSGPLATLQESLALPACLREESLQPFNLYAAQDYWLLCPQPECAQNFPPSFQSVNDWQPGMRLLHQSKTNLRASANAEVSALWTSLVSPLKNAVTGDVGLDLDLGIQTQAAWQLEADCWWSIDRPVDPGAAVLRLRLASARRDGKQLQVKALAAAGLDHATRQALAALLQTHRGQLLQRLRKGVYQGLDKLTFLNQATGLDVQNSATEAENRVAQFLDQWLQLPAAEQALQWRSTANGLLRNIRQALEAQVAPVLDQADFLTQRLEKASLQTTSKKLEASLAAAFDATSSNQALLDAEFDFAANNPRLEALLRTALAGDLDAILAQPEPGLKLNRCHLGEQLQTRQTFSWRLPWVAGQVSYFDRRISAVDALESATGRLFQGTAAAESARCTRRAASLLQLEASFASIFKSDIAVHSPAELDGHFELDIRTKRPERLRPLLGLYGLNSFDAQATRLRLQVVLPAKSLDHWLQPQDIQTLSRQLQSAWRTLLPAIVDLADLQAPILVWSSLPIAAGARRTDAGLQVNIGGDHYWDWHDPELLEAMVWNSRTRSRLELSIAQAKLDASPDELCRSLSQNPGKAVFASLLSAECALVERLRWALPRLARFNENRDQNVTEAIRNFSCFLAGITDTFHRRLSSVYGHGAASALGPLLLTLGAPTQPQATAVWSR